MVWHRTKIRTLCSWGFFPKHVQKESWILNNLKTSMNIMVNVNLEFRVLVLSYCNYLWQHFDRFEFFFVSEIRSITNRMKVVVIPGLYQRFTSVIPAYVKKWGFLDGGPSSAMEHPSFHWHSQLTIAMNTEYYWPTIRYAKEMCLM